MKLEVITRKPSTAQKTTPLLFVHGAWHAAWCWDETFLPYFAEHGYEAHAVSLRGHGGSEGPTSLKWVRIHDYVADVAQAAAQLSSPPVVIGHSLGGLVVQKYLEQYEAPGGVLVASMPVGGTLGVTLRVLFHDPIGFLKLNLIQDLYPVVSTPDRARWVLFADNTPQEKVNEYFSRLQSEAYMAYFESIFMTLPRPKRVKASILVMSGEHDNLFSIREGERTAKAYNARFELIPNVAHSMMLDVGWQTAADRMLAWLQDKGL